MTEPDYEPLPWQEAYDDNGVDRSLVRYALRQTPAERLQAWQSFVDMVNSARRVERPGKVQVLSLERLIEVKRKLDRPKDKLMLLQLEATLSERSKLG